MRKKLNILLIFCLLQLVASAQSLKSYQIYNKSKDTTSFGEMIKALSNYDVVLFGEYHNNSMIHWLELKTEEALYKYKGDQLVLGAEMFERDNQQQLDSFLLGTIDEKQLGKSARLWPNFHTDYKPLVDFAKEKQLRFIATNIPRSYAAMVAKAGIDTLSGLPAGDRQYFANLPVKVDMSTPGYTEMLSMVKEHAGDKGMNFVAAQASKDATMAESILQNRKDRELFLHFNGDYHSKEYGGIYWYLKESKKKLKVAVISVAESDSDFLYLPDGFVATEFNIVIPADMTKTY